LGGRAGEAPLAPPFFHIRLLSRAGSDRVPVDFPTFRTDRDDSNTVRWQVAMLHCSPVPFVCAAGSYGVAITNTTSVDDLY
jgi:hypothetical protein